MWTEVGEEQFGRTLQSFDHTAFRLELQPAYAEPCERETVQRFLADDAQSPTAVAELRAWFDQVAEQTAQGKRVERVRVQDNPPTGYQQWERWAGRWNEESGEVIRYLTRQRAHEIELLPAAGTDDWWLLDSRRLLVMKFDPDGRRISNLLTDDPTIVVRACAWRDLAVHHGAPE